MYRLLIALACASAAFALNETIIDKHLIDRISQLINTNESIDLTKLKTLANNTDFLNKELVTILNNYVNQDNVDNVNETRSKTNDGPVKSKRDDKSIKSKTNDDTSYDVVKKEAPTLVESIEESPDYASSIVLASDVLSLTSAVANVESSDCREQGYMFLNGLLQNKRWALQMFDSSAKSPEGLLYGSSYHLGNFDECVGVSEEATDEPAIQGQYCLATIKWHQSETNKKLRTGRGEILRWAICVPSACDADTVAQFVSAVLSRSVGNTTSVQVKERDCYHKQPVTVSTADVVYLYFVGRYLSQWGSDNGGYSNKCEYTLRSAAKERDCYQKQTVTVSTADVVYLSVLLFFMAVIVISTCYEVFCIVCERKKKTRTHELVVSFSMFNNMKKILSTKQNNVMGLNCISGIKALSMVLILAGHTSMFVGTGPVMDASGWDNALKNPNNALVLNSMLLVDTFLMLSAFLFSRMLLVELDKRRGKLNVLPIMLFRYLRLTPSYLVVIWFYITWLPKIGEGPLWKDKIQLEQERCRESWWINILYVNNYVDPKNMCMFQSWYLSVDTQLFFIAPIFIYSLWRWRRVGPALLGAAIFVSILIPAIITYKEHLDPTMMIFAKEFTDIISNHYFSTAYIKTHMKMTTYFIGLLMGYILYRIQTENYQISRPIKILGWISNVVLGVVTTFLVCIFYQDWYVYNKVEAAAYASLHRLAWGLANGWLIIACATGNGGIMNRFLSWKFFVPIARLTFSSYLVNGIVELFFIGQLRHPLHITTYSLVEYGVAHVILTFVLGALLCVTFESPIHGIEKILLSMFVYSKKRDIEGTKEESRRSSRDLSRNTSQAKLESS